MGKETRDDDEPPGKPEQPRRTLKRIRRDLAAELGAIYASLTGEWSSEDERVLIARLLRTKGLDTYVDDIAGWIQQAEDQQRQVRAGELQRQGDLFTREAAQECVIRLGNGLRVKLVDANWEHLEVWRSQQVKNISRAVASLQFTNDLLDDVREFMQPDRAKTFDDAYVALGKWSPKPKSES